jgi:hypothetical protein
MDENTSPLKAWESFYVIVGSSAGALTGLQFVVLTLITEAGMLSGSGESLAAFGSPNVVHFCTALLVSAIASAPWSGIGPEGVAFGLVGIGGLIYSINVLRRSLRQKDYKPVLEDWIWHTSLPILAYAALVHSGIMIARGSADTEWIVGGASLLLVFIGIHNAWDTVTYVTLERSKREREKKEAAKRAAALVPGGAPSATPSTPEGRQA